MAEYGQYQKLLGDLIFTGKSASLSHQFSAITYNPKPSEVTFSAVFSNISKYRPVLAGDVIHSVAIDGINVSTKFCDSKQHIQMLVSKHVMYSALGHGSCGLGFSMGHKLANQAEHFPEKER